MTRFLLVLLFSAVMLPVFAALDEQSEIEVVAELYRAYAWEAVIDEPQGGTSVVDASQEVLERFFTTELASLIVADRECTVANQEMCALSFAILWNSQDPAASWLTVRSGDASGQVDVSYVYPGLDERIQLTYTLERETSGWRISDIGYSDGYTLHGLLTGAY
jgi:hypothetical protein